ncbi:tumor necrosis factor receptor superfamily member 11A isoform X2 [Melospiza georgiana]|uniref:tumor necrosis factor receptor superfamily member 11A isoform X2 n=1 Tax=Melospiza georgiana TaxID=44398 RepID=UPI0025ACE44A|nr:tumor necrosis factor receptor superfamily member 11A isoform X2 [Melospiza georgiana]
MPVPSGCWLLLLCLAAAGKQLSLQITPPCESEQHYEYLGRCCRKCEPGKYLSARCTATSDSVCQPCGPNEYMDVWNEEDKCLLHKICDQGKALREVNPGNSTFQRQCACTTGYHWNEDCDCCQRNTMCAPGLGVKPPVQQDRDTMCIPCPRGYFSKVSSSTDECKSWTNCTALGMEEIVPGTDKSDAVCKEQKMPEPSEDGTNRILYVLIVVLFFVTLIGIVVFIVYYKKKGKKLTDLQNWANEVCSQIKGTKELRRDALVTVNITNAPVPQTAEGTCLLVPSGSPVPGKSCCTSGHTACSNESPSTEPCEAGEFSVVTETDDYQFPPVPTEDEYMDKDLNNTDYLSLLSQSASKTVSSFSQPMEAGENDSLNQYFSGIGSTEDVSVSPGFHPPSNTDGAHVATDQLLQKSCQHAHSCPKETGNKDIDNFATNCDPKKICVRCGVLYRESPQKCYKPCRAAADSTSTSPETGSCAQCTCGLNFLSAGQSTLGNNLGMEDAPSDSTNVNTNGSTSGTQSSTSGTNSSTSDLPPASGNVTGNSNSTFISSGQVMNFKGDIIVVYLSQNSQEGTAASSGLSEDNVGSPVQEENLSRCETFAGNAQHYKEKCAELQGARPAPGSGAPRSPGEALAQEWGPSCGGQASQPVQEEGKLGHFSEKVLN